MNSAAAARARDIYTVHGRRYMDAGSQLTEKFISILSDLRELENLQSKVWITKS